LWFNSIITPTSSKIYVVLGVLCYAGTNYPLNKTYLRALPRSDRRSHESFEHLARVNRAAACGAGTSNVTLYAPGGDSPFPAADYLGMPRSNLLVSGGMDISRDRIQLPSRGGEKWRVLQMQ
jgi:hypothetical protein